MSLIATLIERRKALKSELEAGAEVRDEAGEIRAMNDDEKSAWSAKVAEVKELDERIAELQEAEVREAAAAKHHVEVGTAAAEARVTNEPNPVYRADDSTRSFFKDIAVSQNPMLGATLGAGYSPSEVRERLVKSQETRAGDMTTAAGAGGEFAPPLWLVDEFINLARAGRVTADLCNGNVLPSGVSSINLPKVAGGTATAVQQTQNSALQDTAMTTTSVSSGITTVGGKQIVSMQLLQQSAIPFDRVILGDLAADYAVQVDKQVLYGTNVNGQVRGLVGVANNTAYTTASPSPASGTSTNSLLYYVSKAAAAAQTSIFNSVDALVMHPVRWAWIVGSTDTAGRPFVVPSGPAFNQAGTGDLNQAQGAAGTFAGIPVYVDPNISQTANSATNQDEIYLIRRGELWLYESPVQTASFDATYADNASVLFRILGYIGFIPNRRTGAVQSIRGTGLVTPA